MATARPDATEAIEYYFRYIHRVPEGDVVMTLARQREEMLTLFRGVSDEVAARRPAPGKWTLREVLSHVTDTERVFAARGHWFARGMDAPLPGFEQDDMVATADAEARTWASHVEEFAAVREATRTLFASLPPEAWSRRGTASGNPFTVRAVAYVVVGHADHHLAIVREKYLVPAP